MSGHLGPEAQGRLLRRATYASVATAAVLIAAKLVAWLLTGSVSLLASLVDSLMDAGASLINEDRMWHYTEGVRNWDPIWPGHGIRILPGPSSMWFDARGSRLPSPCLPGFDTLATLKHILATGHDWSWFVLTQKIIKKE